jgi:Rhabdovirus nucleocapsid protein
MKIKSQGWAASVSFRMIMAAMDFFFVKFPNHIYGSIRLGTVMTRYEDCSIISLLDYFSSLFGVEDVFQYILFPTAIKEFKEILSSYEETDKGTHLCHTVALWGL